MKNKCKVLMFHLPQQLHPKINFIIFFPPMENLVAIIDSYTYDFASKKVGQRIVKRIKINEDVEEEVMEQ